MCKVNLPGLIHEKKLTIRARRKEKKLNNSESISEDSDFENNMINSEKASQDTFSQAFVTSQKEPLVHSEEGKHFFSTGFSTRY